MINPQLENGYVKIANEIMEAFGKYRIPGEQRQILDVIIRKTYGFNKKEDMISNSQFVIATGLKKPSICRAINALIDKNIVSKKDNKRIPSYQFNKNYHTWKPLAKKLTVSKKVNPVLAKKLPTKDTSTKDKEHTAFNNADEVDFYLTRKKRKLSGKRLKTFDLFWDSFNYKKGKAEAADSWLDIPVLTDSLVDEIIRTAKIEAENRGKLIEQSKIPKMAQGWLSGKRWEDEIKIKPQIRYEQVG